ncbi:hypothetical protein LBW56_24305 [Ralstonia solanacearum]|nr:hypothetical protein [Ralstonia solanacearum]
MRFKTPVIDDVLSSNIDAMLEDKLLDLLDIHISRMMPPNIAAPQKLNTVDCVARRTHFDPRQPLNRICTLAAYRTTADALTSLTH